MEHIDIAMIIVVLSCWYPIIVIALYPVLYILWIMYSTTRGADKITADVKKKGHMVIAKYVSQKSHYMKKTDNNAYIAGYSYDTKYTYEYKGKKYKKTFHSSTSRAPRELPLYFYRNPRKAFFEGGFCKEKIPRFRMLLLAIGLAFAGCIVFAFLCRISPAMMEKCRHYYRILETGNLLAP